MPDGIIAHLDMDAFFAAVEERDKPHLRGRPIVVGADPMDGLGRGVVATANYKAREFGIHSAMPIGKAWRLAEAARRKGAPEAAWIVPHGQRYGEASRRIMGILAREVAVIEQTSVDEAYLDLGFLKTYEKAIELCRALKRRIREAEGLTASIGIGPNKLIAKIASDMQKPDGLTAVAPEEAEEFLAPLSVRKVPGIGPKTEAELAARGVRTIRDLKRFSEKEMAAMFGAWGLGLYEKARGRSDAPVTAEHEAKSIGAQETFAADTREANALTGELKMLAAGVIGSLRREGFRSFGRVVVTVRFSDFETKTRSRTLPAPAADLPELEFEALRLFLPFLDRRENPREKSFRLLGVRVEKLA